MKSKALLVWLQNKAASEYSEWWIALVGVFETVLFLPIDPFLIFFTIERPTKYLRYAVFAALSSVVGGSIAYCLGASLWHLIGAWILKYLISPHFFETLIGWYQSYRYYVVFVGAFFPLPFKAITLSAGFCHISFFSFVFTLAVARISRFFLVTWVTRRWGSAIQSFIDRYSAPVISLVCVKCVIVLGLAYFLKG